MARKDSIDGDVMEWLWGWFEAVYGNAFTAQYGKHAKRWQVELVRAGVTPEMLKRGMSECLASGDRMPPNLPQFLARCRLARPSVPCHREYRSLPRPDIGADGVARVREQLRFLMDRLRVGKQEVA